MTWSDRLYELLGLSPDDRSPSLEQFLARIASDDRSRVRRLLHDTTPPGKASAIECRYAPDASRWLRLEIVPEAGAAVAPDRIVGTVQDVTQRKRLRRRLRDQRFFDPLTGLPSRALLLDRADHAIERADRADQPLALLYVNIDDFQAINEEFGHPGGDELLVMVAKRLKRSVRSSDTVARPKRASDTVSRITGDEFALLLEGSGEKEAKVVADRLHTLLEAPFEVAHTAVHLSTSFGLSIREPDDEALPTARDLLRAGETALYTARKNRTQVHVFDSSTTPDSDRFQRREALRRALRRDEFVPYYQPIVDVNTTAVTEVEALLRWDHPERGLVPPSEFIPLAEETGLIADLDRWVLEHAIEQVATWRASGDGPQRVSVNVTASRHSGTDFQSDVQQLLHEHNVPGEALTLETTERVAFRQTRPFETLRREGVHIAIDDFGTGYSALFYLRTFDADVLKIDRGFISELGTGSQTEILVRAMLDIATHMDMTAIAEGVETEAQLDELRTLGCPSAQGYLFGRPMPAAALEQALAEGALRLSA